MDINDPAISIERLQFRYPRQERNCLEDIDLRISKGERFGLFGPNGAGKTTLMGIMTGLLKPSGGTAHLLGQEIYGNSAIKQNFGYVPQDLAFYPELSPAENLAFFGAWSGLNRREIAERTHELLGVLGLSDVAHKPVKTFSGGMKRRVNIAIGVVHRPQILFLDEPTVGVDVQTRSAIVEYLKLLNNDGTTLVYTSHHLQEAEQLCTRIALIDMGQILLHGDLEPLLKENQDGLEGLFLKLTGREYRD